MPGTNIVGAWVLRAELRSCWFGSVDLGLWGVTAMLRLLIQRFDGESLPSQGSVDRILTDRTIALTCIHKPLGLSCVIAHLLTGPQQLPTLRSQIPTRSIVSETLEIYLQKGIFVITHGPTYRGHEAWKAQGILNLRSPTAPLRLLFHLHVVHRRSGQLNVSSTKTWMLS